jgi:hypothetical protein
VGIQEIAVAKGYTKEEILDRMLPPLHDALLLRMSEKWSKDDVSNMHSCEIYEVARWWLAGMNVGSAAIFDGICAQCGSLLHGALHVDDASSNKCCAPPCNRDGVALPLLPDGSPQVNAQPPFVLRYSPSFLGRSDSAPAWFVHSKGTNRLSLRQGVHSPWIRAEIKAGEQAVWLFCDDCKDRCSGKRTHSHIPYRDKASQNWIRPLRRVRKEPRPAPKETPAANIPEPRPPERDDKEPDVGEIDSEGEALGDVPADVDATADGGAVAACDDEDDLDEVERVGAFAARGYVPKCINVAPGQEKTLEEYKSGWDEKLASHSKGVAGEFCRDNLVPKPIPDR